MNITRSVTIFCTTALFITFFAINTATAQQSNSNGTSSNPGETSIGLTAGIGPSSHIRSFRYVSGDIDLDLTPNVKSGFNAGIIFRQGFSKNFRIQLEPSIRMMGARYNESFELRGHNFQTDSETELTYLQLPLIFQFSTVPPERTVYGRQFSETTYHFSGGVFWGYLLDARFSGTNTGAPIGIEFQGEFTNNVEHQYSSYDAGLILGVGFESGIETKVGFETRVLGSVMGTGEDINSSFSPHNLALTFNLYFVY